MASSHPSRHWVVAVAAMALILSSCVRLYKVNVVNPCPHSITVVLTDAWESLDVRDAMTSGDFGQWADYEETLEPLSTRLVGSVEDVSGFEAGFTLWVDSARFRLDFNIDQLENADHLIHLPETACRQALADTPMAEAFLDTPVTREPIAEWARRDNDS